VRNILSETLGPLLPALESLLQQQGVSSAQLLNTIKADK
jgi:hypothetical protein